MLRRTILALALCSRAALANTPGKHTITYAWVDAACDNSITCSYNLYRGSVTGVCHDGAIPYTQGIIGATYTDTNTPPGTYFAAVSAFDPTQGGESTCSAEVQSLVPPIQTKQPTQMQGKVN
jgi:hypothetical protein